MPERVEFFFSFRSPYSYLVGPRAFALPERWDIELVWRPVRPMVTRGVPLPSSKRLHLLRDAWREAQHLGMPFGRIWDPLGEGVERCLNLSLLADEQGRLAPFVLAASRMIWAEGTDMVADSGPQKAAAEAGLDWQACAARLGDPGYSAVIDANIARLRELGLWGVPSFSFRDEVFWGQDRLQHLERAFERGGVGRK